MFIIHYETKHPGGTELKLSQNTAGKLGQYFTLTSHFKLPMNDLNNCYISVSQRSLLQSGVINFNMIIPPLTLFFRGILALVIITLFIFLEIE